MLIPRVLLAPHVATLLMDERRRHRTEMMEAYAEAARALAAEQPAAIVALSARWVASGPFLVDAAPRHVTLTDYYGFGVEVRYDCHGAPKLAEAIVAAAHAGGVRAATTARGVDSGVSVPLHFLASRRLQAVVPISLAAAPATAHRAWGAALRRALDASPERIAFVVGGMLSYNLHAWNLRREVPEAQDFDHRALEALGAGEWTELARLAMRRHVRACPEASLLHLEVLHGLLGADLPGRLLCYEPGPGVGGALMEFLVGEPAEVPPVAPETAKRDPRLHVPVAVERPARPRPVRPGAPRPGGPRPGGPRPGGPRPGGPRPGGPRPGGPRPGGPRPGGPRPGGPRPGGPRPGGPRPGGPRPGGPLPGGPRPGGPRPGGPRPGGPRPGAPRPGGPRPGGLRPGGPRPGGPRPGGPRPGGPRPGGPRPGGPRRTGPPRRRDGGPRPGRG